MKKSERYIFSSEQEKEVTIYFYICPWKKNVILRLVTQTCALERLKHLPG